MSATVDIQTNEANGIIIVPIQSVTTRADSSMYKDKEINSEEDAEQGIEINNLAENNNKNTDLIKIEECVFIYSNGKAKIVKVKTGIQDNNYIQIKEGVKVGDELIAGPYSAIAKQLNEATEVNKVDKSELFNGSKK